MDFGQTESIDIFNKKNKSGWMNISESIKKYPISPKIEQGLKKLKMEKDLYEQSQHR